MPEGLTRVCAEGVQNVDDAFAFYMRISGSESLIRQVVGQRGKCVRVQVCMPMQIATLYLWSYACINRAICMYIKSCSSIQLSLFLCLYVYMHVFEQDPHCQHLGKLGLPELGWLPPSLVASLSLSCPQACICVKVHELAILSVIVSPVHRVHRVEFCKFQKRLLLGQVAVRSGC